MARSATARRSRYHDLGQQALALDRDGLPVGDSSVQAAATTLYGATSNNSTIYNATTPSFSAAFGSSYQLYHVETADEDHLMVYKPSTATGFDSTLNFSALMGDAGAVLLVAADALRYGKAYAELANAEFELDKTIVGAANSSELGMSISDPSAVSVIGGWQVFLTTWIRTNGVVANWTINFTLSGLDSARWEIVAKQRGPYDADFRGLMWRNGTWISNLHSVTPVNTSAYHAATTGDYSLGCAVDGSAWTMRIRYRDAVGWGTPNDLNCASSLPIDGDSWQEVVAYGIRKEALEVRSFSLTVT